MLLRRILESSLFYFLYYERASYHQKIMHVVKLCSDKILQFLTGSIK